ncbi:hypothetical protein H4R34_001642 [Dimargaris verticillata]|uniref:UV-stimulated scaffold protein A C-terminal domain-containing protein n=1 Tax=Dimargaris verticillata TaxID=2761393 RepID=A0A9W8B545_9FUNG|nr:hypothetical protein H4R34_001642 [Dimargaris verticillata]
MEDETRHIITHAIRDLATAGTLELDQAKLKTLKRYCKESVDNITLVYNTLMVQLAKRHAQVRYSTTQVIIELFGRSHHFRNLLVNEFPKFLSLTLGIYGEELPLPVSYAKRLKVITVRAIKEWRTTYTGYYKPLQLGYNYVVQRFNTNLDASSVDVLSHAEEQQRQQRLQRKRTMDLRKFLRIQNSFEDRVAEIHRICYEMDAALDLLVPNIEATFDATNHTLDDSTAVEMAPFRETMGALGMGSSRYQVSIEFDPSNPFGVQETAENRVIYDKVREFLKEVTKRSWPWITRTLARLSKLEVEDKQKQDSMVKQLITEKQTLNAMRLKCAELRITADEPPTETNSAVEDESEDEFEEVLIPASSQPDYEQAPEPTLDTDAQAAASGSLGHDFKDQPALHTPDQPQPPAEAAHETEEDLLRRAPVVEYGPDLYYWEKDKVEFNQGGLEFKHRFLGEGGGEKFLSDDTLDRLRKRAVYYTPKRPDHIKACRAPLKSGKLCPRRDLVRCPYHGPIVPRDEQGWVVALTLDGKQPEDTEVELQDTFVELDHVPWHPPSASSASATSRGATTSAASQPQWQSIEHDVIRGAVATGASNPQLANKLHRLADRRHPKQKRKSNLVDIKQQQDTARKRIERQLNNPKLNRMAREVSRLILSML